MPDLIPRELIEDLLREIKSLKAEFRSELQNAKEEIINSIKSDFKELKDGIDSITLIDIN